MKATNLLNFIAFTMMVFTSIFLVSCGSDNDEPQNSTSDYVGIWSVQHVEGWGLSHDGDNGFEYIQFKKDGTFIDIQEDEYETKGYAVSYGELTVSENKLKIKETSGFFAGTTFTYDIEKKEKLTISMWGATAYLIRVSDKTIEKYL